MNSTTHEALFDTTATPCPTWCTLPAGHGYDSSDTAGEYRGHEREVGHVRSGGRITAFVGIDALESATFTEAGVSVTVSEPMVALDTTPGEGLTAGEARALARLLLQAADRLDTAASDPS